MAAKQGFIGRIFGGKTPASSGLMLRPAGQGLLDTATFRRLWPDYVLGMPQRFEHLEDIVEARQIYDSQTLLSALFKSDPDTSAALHGYLTLANTPMISVAVDLDGDIDRAQTKLVNRDVNRITRQVDYTKGFALKESLPQLNANLRYMLLLRGALAGELLLDDARRPTDITFADPVTLRWFEPVSGQYKPSQIQQAQQPLASLDLATFIVAFYRRNPTEIYSSSPFVSAINTLAARTGVINDLNRIMRITGYPRLDVKIVAEVLLKNAPANVRADSDLQKTWMAQQMQTLALTVEGMSSESAFVHPDSIEAKILNDKNPTAGLDVEPMIRTLNAQNQAGLKTVSTILGRGESGANTGSVEARIAAMFADEVNEPVAEFWAKALTFAAHQRGFQGWVEVRFRSCEMRPDLELEPQKTLKAARLRQDLSDGMITDDEYHLEMYGRLPPAGSVDLQGTGFLAQVPNGDQEDPSKVDPADVSPNDDALGRSMAPDQTKMTKANPKKSSGPAKKPVARKS